MKCKCFFLLYKFNDYKQPTPTFPYRLEKKCQSAKSFVVCWRYLAGSVSGTTPWKTDQLDDFILLFASSNLEFRYFLIPLLRFVAFIFLETEWVQSSGPCSLLNQHNPHKNVKLYECVCVCVWVVVILPLYYFLFVSSFFVALISAEDVSRESLVVVHYQKCLSLLHHRVTKNSGTGCLLVQLACMALTVKVVPHLQRPAAVARWWWHLGADRFCVSMSWVSKMFTEQRSEWIQ